MSTETKDIIEKNIEARVETDFNELKKEIKELLCRHLPSSTEGVYSRTLVLQGESYGKCNAFLKDIELVAKKHFKEKREKEFSEILSNLGSYLQMINR